MKFNNEFLVKKMKKYEFSMAELSRRLKRYDNKSSRTLVLNWIKGGTTPSIRYLVALSEIFNCKIKDFLKD